MYLVEGKGYGRAAWIKYKVSSVKVMKIEPKLEMKRRTVKSPDATDGLILTPGTPDPVPVIH